MPLVASSIPNLISGVSQQPQTLRLPTSCDEMINAWPSVVTGLNKRPPSEFIANLPITIPNGANAYLIDREGTYRYIAVLTGSTVLVYDLFGNAQTVTYPDGVSYITDTDPIANFAFLTVGDTTFIVNKTKVITTSTVAEDGTRLDPGSRATVHVTQSYANTNYNIYVNNTLAATYLTANGIATQVPGTSDIAASLGAALTTNGFIVAVIGSTIEITALAAGTKVRGSSSQGDRGLKWYTDTVNEFTALPPNASEGRLVKIKGALKDNGDDYYVTFNNGVWTECAGYGAWEIPTDTTMPYKLVRQSNGTWIFSKHVWKKRNAGDATSNKNPSFVGSKLNDIFFYTNRMGFLADENVILSQSSVFENFYRTTLATLVDSDRLDYAVFNTGVDILRHAVPFDKDLLLMSDRAQYRLTYQNYLGPKNTQVTFSTSFNVAAKVKPINIGNSVYFVDDKTEYQYAKVFEYFPKENRVGDDADDSTAPVPTYIAANIAKLSGSPRVKCAAILPKVVGNTLYLYKFFWSGQNKIQNAWFKWTFPDTTKIEWVDFSKNYLYLLLSRPDGVSFEKIRMDEQVYNPSRYLIDRQVPKASLTLSYSAITNKTTITLPYSTAGTVEIVGSYNTGNPDTSFSDFRCDVTKLSGTQVTVTGDVTAWQTLTAGIQYDKLFRFNTFYIRDKTASGNVVQLDAHRLQMRYLKVRYENTAYFTTTVAYPGRTTRNGVFESKNIGNPSVLIGATAFLSGEFAIPLMGNNEDMTVEIHNDSPYASAIASAEFLSIYTPKAKLRL